METSTELGLRALLCPTSIAIIGATERKLALGERIVRYLLKHGYKGRIYPINPQYQRVMGLPCFSSLQDVLDPIDLALIAVSADRVFSALEECAQKQVRTATVFASGFGESGPDGMVRQEKLREIVRRTGLRICGPNCMGTINVREGIVASFGNAAEMEKFIPGSVGIVAQSGGLAGSIFDRAQEKGLGISYVVSSGNEVDLEAADYCSFMLDDPGTKAIMVFAEGLKDGPKFVSMAERALYLGKPIVIFKAGRSEQGRKAAATHTGSLTGSDEVHDAVFKQKGVIRVHDIDELVDVTSLLAKYQETGGNSVGVMAPSGAAGVIISDKCEEYGLRLPQPSNRTTEELGKVLPDFGSVSNPLDPTGQGYGDPRQLRRCMEVFVRDENFDTVLIQVPTVAGDFAVDFAQGVVQAVSMVTRPVAALCTGGGLSQPAIEVLKDNGIPFFLSFDSCFKAIASLVRYSHLVKLARSGEADPVPIVLDPGARNCLLDLLESNSPVLTEQESKSLLSLYSVPCTQEALARNPDEAVAIANRIGYPVAMKVQSPQIPHKTEARVIRLGIHSDGEVRNGFQELLENASKWDPQARIDGVLVQEMVKEGVETIVGVSSDPQFGPTILFGLGGIFVEVLKDVSMRIAPLTRRDAEEMVREVKGFPILQGARGRPKADLDALVDVLLSLSKLAIDSGGRISQLDINPLVVLEEGQGAKAVDALVLLEKASARQPQASPSDA